MKDLPLCIDIGNSNICAISFCDNRSFLRCESDTSKDTDFFAYWLDREVKPVCGAVTGAIISSVVPDLTKKLDEAIRYVFGFRPMILTHELQTGLSIDIKDPRELGYDLIAGAVGAIREYPLPAIVADLGTATKFSVIDKDGMYRGCAIMPGVKTSFNALVKNAALLSEFEFQTPESPVGRDSVEALNIGAVCGTAAMVDGMCEQYEEFFGARPTVILTGGLSFLISETCKYPMLLDEWIIGKGLLYIYTLNGGKNAK